MLRKLNQILFKPKILIFSLIIFANSILAMPAQELFLQANQLYLSQDYVGALAAYEKLEHKAGIVWHNMGNCYFYPNNLVYKLNINKEKLKKKFNKNKKRIILIIYL